MLLLVTPHILETKVRNATQPSWFDWDSPVAVPYSPTASNIRGKERNVKEKIVKEDITVVEKYSQHFQVIAGDWVNGLP